MKAKRFKLRAEDIVELIPPMGGCIASDRITVDGLPVGSLFREAAERADDSGWVFLAGDETQAYLDDPEHFAVYSVNTIANYDPEIIPFLYALPGQRFDRHGPSMTFEEAPDSQADAQAASGPPGVQVEQGHVGLSGRWTIELPTPFRRRREDESLVVWRPGLTFWISPFQRAKGSAREALMSLRAGISNEAFDVQSDERAGLSRLFYRLRELSTDAKVPSLYAFLVGKNGHLQVGAYFDREVDHLAARAILDTVQER